MTDLDEPRATRRTRIVDAAVDLLRERGPAALTTRGVAERAGVQQPAIFRTFGDKDGLLDAVAEHIMAEFAAAKAGEVAAEAERDDDPVVDLRAGWAGMIEFGLANPSLFRLLSDPERVARSPAARIGREALRSRVRRIAAAGCLRVAEDLAVAMIQAAGGGAIQVLLATPQKERDVALADAMYEAVLAQILVGAPDPSRGPLKTALVTLRAVGPDLTALTPAERGLLDDWIERALAAP